MPLSTKIEIWLERCDHRFEPIFIFVPSWFNEFIWNISKDSYGLKDIYF